MKLTVIPPKKINYWKRSKALLLNRSRRWRPAESYRQAREQALEANAEVQHRNVR